MVIQKGYYDVAGDDWCQRSFNRTSVSPLARVRLEWQRGSRQSLLNRDRCSHCVLATGKAGLHSRDGYDLSGYCELVSIHLAGDVGLTTCPQFWQQLCEVGCRH